MSKKDSKESIEELNFKDKNHEVLINLVRTSSLLTKFSHRFFSQFEINDGQFNILMTLRRFPKGLSQTQIGDRLIVAKPNLVGMIDKLEKKGYVTRQTNPKDRRLNSIQITQAGRRILAAIEPDFDQVVDMFFQELSSNKKNMLVDSMSKVRKSIEASLAN